MNTKDMTRRSAIALAATPLLSAQSPNDTVRVAMIGVGNRGSFLLRHTLRIPGVQVVAIADIDEERLKAAVAQAEGAGQKPEGFTDFRRMLDRRKDIDAVIIATPVDTHKDIALGALEVGKHVYCEKPMAHREEDVKMMVLGARNAKGVFQSGFQLRHDPARSAAMSFIKSGELGSVLFLQAYRHTGDLPRQTGWYFDAARSGNNIVEQACHILDLMTWAAGKPPLRAFGSGGINLYKDIPPGRTTLDNYAVIYEFPDDVRLVFSHIYFDPASFSGIKERVFCAKGAIELPTATWHELGERGRRGPEMVHKLEVPDAGKDATYQSLAAFVDNARGKKTPLNNAESAARSTLMAMMGRKAISEKRVVTWDEMIKI
ncbi:MAG: Gfo/Idh/MocA family oxidoreductase [Acidobacteria bacterium]|nr:Gfo/Idh/MocA family oxidoreductase [Acidobacteriota bacterium]MBI3281611.1 Gfo/Idh/MocA family oxidoreductase [Acidobacteriota bacterium]